MHQPRLVRCVGVQSLQDVIVYAADATYQAGLTYTFTINMVPTTS